MNAAAGESALLEVVDSGGEKADNPNNGNMNRDVKARNGPG